MPIDDDRRALLRQAKVASIVAEHWDGASGTTGSFPDGATLRGDGRAWVLIEKPGVRAAGGPMLWASRHDVDDLHVILDGVESALAGDLARRLSAFVPSPTTWSFESSTPALVTPAGLPAILGPPQGVETLVDVLEAAGVEVVLEHGIIRGEILGLEVARVVEHPDGDPRIEVGVGQFDRATAAMMYAELPVADALAVVVDEIRRHRFPGAPPHPIGDLCRERWLRCSIEAEPSVVGASHLVPAENTVDRTNLKDPFPAISVGEGVGGALVVASTYGVDVDLPAMAADARRLHAPDAELVLASASPLPEVMVSMADRLGFAVRVVEVDPPWAAAERT